MTVYLVGAGPGDPGLMTARALELIAAADVIVYDRLIPDQALAGARPDATLIYGGKEGGGASMPQDEIERLLRDHGAAGSLVVRLKGGDPFVFGRGGEEAEALREAGIEFEVVPGVTSGVAAPAYAGIPVTHRELASAVAFVTGHEDPDKAESALDWRALAAFPGTLVLYMGVRRLGAIADRLIEGGRNADEPAAVVQRGTLPDQRAIVATLRTLAEAVERELIRAPAIVVIGPVAALRERLQWFERRPLAGVTVAITRARDQASAMGARLRALGAGVVEAPAIRIVHTDGPAPDLRSYDLICVTSPNGVEALFARLDRAGLDARAFGAATVAAIGPGTARALARRGIRADIVPDRFVAEGLVEAVAEVPVSRALIARAARARDVLPDELGARGAEVDVLPVYETVVEPLDAERLAAVANADYLTFTASSTVTSLLAALEDRDGVAERQGPRLLVGEGGRRPRIVSIGPVTSGTLREHNLEPDVEASAHDIDGLIEALIADAGAEVEALTAPVITLLTDFGLADEYVGVLHGVIAKICPDAKVIDITHEVTRHDVRSGAGILAQSLPFMPIGVHVAVVDPGVGGERRAVALRVADGRVLVGPDNGLLWLACEEAGGVDAATEISRSPWRLEPVSATFHGRDIFAAVAAQLAAGRSFEAAGQPLDPALLVRLDLPRPSIEAGALFAQVSGGDRFGNAQLAARREDATGLALRLGDALEVALPSGETYPARFVRTFGDAPEGELILFEDSAHRLALGFNQGSATGRLALRIGDEVRISRPNPDAPAVVGPLRR